MGSTELIDAIVRQTTVLLAGLATAGGRRAQLAGLANQVFADLVGELKRQGVGNKVIADMFGMALRTYHGKVARISESRSLAGQSIWDGVLAFVGERGPVLRADVLRRFARDDAAVVRGVLKDLVDSGLATRDGTGEASTYRLTSPDDLASNGSARQHALANLVAVALHQHGPLSLDALAAHVPMDGQVLAVAAAWRHRPAVPHACSHISSSRNATSTNAVQTTARPVSHGSPKAPSGL